MRYSSKCRTVVGGCRRRAHIQPKPYPKGNQAVVGHEQDFGPVQKSSSPGEPSRLLLSASLRLPRGGCGGCVPFPRGSQGSCGRPTPGAVSWPGAGGVRGLRVLWQCCVWPPRNVTPALGCCRRGHRLGRGGDTHSPLLCPALPWAMQD